MSKVMKTPEATLSYPSVFRPRAANDGATPKYEATFVFGPDADLSTLRQAVKAAGEEKWGDKFPEMVKKGQVRLPFRTDWEEKGYPEDSTFFAARRNAERNGPPGVVSVFPSEHDPKKPALITDENKIYPGCIVRGLVSCYAYDKAGNRGITFGLEGLQKIRDGERLDGRVNVQNAFDVDEAAFADLDQMLDAEPEADEPEADDPNDIMSLLGG